MNEFFFFFFLGDSAKTFSKRICAIPPFCFLSYWFFLLNMFCCDVMVRSDCFTAGTGSGRDVGRVSTFNDKNCGKLLGKLQGKIHDLHSIYRT